MVNAALLLVDVVNDFLHEDGELLLASFRSRHAALRAELERARGSMPVVYANDDWGRWDANAPGLVRTAMTERTFPEDAPWTPPELAPELVRKLATGRYDALAGRYLHAEHDDVDELLARIDELRERDLNAIRLRR